MTKIEKPKLNELTGIERITKADYIEILRQNGFITQFNQKHLF